ncbi:MAG: IclR family transcriptional regulator [Dethiosulfovibrio peptidovorans]|nr:MAG: IclR family transcriptional regulator [Dethiosulfovibrio peptidovorans]
MKPHNRVKSVVKAFSIMEALDKWGELSIGQLSEALEMDKATVHRLVSTMREAGYVNQDPDTRRYSNSLKLLAMGNRVMDRTGILKVARPHIKHLAGETGETVNLGILVGSKIVYIDKLESSSTIKVGQDIGADVPCYCSALGKAILAYSSDAVAEKILDHVVMRRYTKNSIVDKVALQEELRRVRETGFALDDEEYVEGLVCISAPVLDFTGSPVAALSISTPRFRFRQKEHMADYSRMVREEAGKISEKIGYGYPENHQGTI